MISQGRYEKYSLNYQPGQVTCVSSVPHPDCRADCAELLARVSGTSNQKPI